MTSDLHYRLKNLLMEKKHTDCSFRIDTTTLEGHKIILSAASPVFEAMFFGPMAEQRCIEISDINIKAFQMMLEYIYTDEIDIAGATIVDLMELYYCAEKYLITKLVKKSVELIQQSLRHTNILQALDLAVCIDINELLKICLNFFTNYCLSSCNFATIIRQNNFHISKECLNCILKCNIKQQNINIICLIKKWCKTEAEMLGLCDDESKLALKGIQIPEYIADDVSNMYKIDISDSTFENSRYSWIVCQRTYYKAIRPLKIGHNTHFVTSITSNQFIALKSLIINSRLTPFIPNCPYTYKENLEVTVSNLEDLRVQKFVVFNVEYNSNVYLVFDNPIMITPDTTYTINFKWVGLCYGYEYPCSTMSKCEKNGFCTLTFDKGLENSFCNDSGTILSGVEYVVLN